MTDAGPVFFRQKRIGLDGKTFILNKFRTMKVDSENQRSKYLKLNEADGPVFKIYNDPRFTGIGKILSRTGMDELPQLINILKGEMSLVGPRPLPVNEARKLSKSQKIREQVRPGIVSTWVTNGSHKLNFRQWMKLDREYVENGNLQTDLKVIKDSTILIVKSIINVLS
jgi:lipopolysaccharide/colanic/teichoic acid biosynthesis glycosyltransferase